MSKNHVIGILAHVDAGKTTLSEQLLFHAGVLRTPGRVDHRDAFLDAHPLERQRGITIFSDQAVFQRNGHRYFWVDTPGHADFAAEMERALSVLDMAVLVVNGAEGIQSHTETLWGLLAAYGVPTVLFINKTDRPACDAPAVLAQLKQRLSGDITDMGGWGGGAMPGGVIEAVAERDEALLDRWMADDVDPAAWLEGLRGQFFRRQLFPVYSGSALNDVGVETLLDALCLLCSGGNLPPQSGKNGMATDRRRYMPQPALPRSGGNLPPQDAPVSALVYKVRHDAQGGRVCFLKVRSGSLRPREEFPVPGGTARVNELRLYSGTKYTLIPEAGAGMLCAAPGLPEARPGDVIGFGGGRNRFHTEPMLAATVLFDKSVPANSVLSALLTLEDEDPALSVSVNEATGGINLRVMGRIQLEVIRQLMQDRFATAVDFGPMRVLYMETVAAPAVGVGHYEPLRHYAEVQLRLVPGPRGSGVRFESLCHVDELALNWQRLIETHVYEKAHRGVLTGAPLTDVVVQLLHGRAHLKHTEGGDFRQSTYRAIRNALMYAQSVLLEPICRFTLRAPADSYGKVMGDLARMHAETDAPQAEGERFTVTGEATVAEFSLYNDAFLAATHGRGQLQYRLDHYAPCRDAGAVIEAAHYNPLADDTPDSVFCSHGAGYTVPWNEVKAHAHCPVEE
ncbi:MAG: TetM/TetW/TetO/TetS family tetracycline resistance ribosomal protection protein [Clostridia bacterium]|nr:TetM/TetW/TetO/TetS family tetracycline resistance ribosomal protection protein [Clostridia bacterium]